MFKLLHLNFQFSSNFYPRFGLNGRLLEACFTFCIKLLGENGLLLNTLEENGRLEKIREENGRLAINCSCGESSQSPG